ncbi:MAG: hypothetical protein JXB14_06290 [Candidatus Altiarchaeota archaeon]|nr:hypothetical protein [Candidatus Altiarchaeota archaeon]
MPKKSVKPKSGAKARKSRKLTDRQVLIRVFGKAGLQKAPQRRVSGVLEKIRVLREREIPPERIHSNRLLALSVPRLKVLVDNKIPINEASEAVLKMNTSKLKLAAPALRKEYVGSLYNENRKLVNWAVRERKPAGLPLTDAMDVVEEAYADACTGFDPNRGTKLSTYLSNTVFRRMKRTNKSRSRRVGKHIRLAGKLLEEKRWSDKATPLSILTATNLPSDLKDRLQRDLQNLQIEHKLLGKIAYRPIRPQEIDLIMRRYGLGPYEAHTLRQVGNAAGFGSERARQVVDQVLRNWMRERGEAYSREYKDLLVSDS